jgi:hypothetical protein
MDPGEMTCVADKKDSRQPCVAVEIEELPHSKGVGHPSVTILAVKNLMKRSLVTAPAAR